MGLRLLLLIIAVALLVWLVRRQLSSARPNAAQPESRSMVRCDHCGLYVPVDEAISGAAGNYCCEAHRQAGRSTQA